MATGSKKVAISNLTRTRSAPGSLGDQVHSLPERLEFLASLSDEEQVSTLRLSRWCELNDIPNAEAETFARI
jgi:hypothetical protein